VRWLIVSVAALACACLSRNDLDDVGPGTSIRIACAGECDLVQTSWATGASDEIALAATARGFLCANHLMDTSGELTPVETAVFAPQGECVRDRFDFDGAEGLAGWSVDRWSLAPGLDGMGVKNDAIGNDDSATLSRTLQGPRWLQLWADVSSECGYDFLTITVDTGQSVRLSGEQRWKLIGVDLPTGSHELILAYGKDGGAISGLDRGLVDSLTLAESAPLAAWRTGGCPFVIDPVEGALRAASCGPTLLKEEPPPVAPSSVELDVFGPGQLDFDWRPSSEAGADFLRYAIDGAMQAEVSGVAVDWAHVERAIDAGTHTLRFYYTKDGGADQGDDTGWIDNLHISGHCFSGAELTSHWIDAGAPVTVDGVWWQADTPADSSVSIYVRTAASPSAAASTPWKLCPPAAWGGAPDATCAPQARYVQYHVELTCAPWAEPPSLRAVGLRWR
jgi:hypothetical protein